MGRFIRELRDMVKGGVPQEQADSIGFAVGWIGVILEEIETNPQRASRTATNTSYSLRAHLIKDQGELVGVEISITLKLMTRAIFNSIVGLVRGETERVSYKVGHCRDYFTVTPKGKSKIVIRKQLWA